MILTITINPSVDKTYILKKFEPNSVNRAHRVLYNAGSKGINVSRVVQLLGQETFALGFEGGTTGDMLLTKLSEEGINHDLVRAKHFSTRLNVKIMDMSASTVTDLNEVGEPVTDSEFEEFLDKYKKMLPKSDIVVISGSILPEMTNRLYYDLTKIAEGFNKSVFLDCGGVVLKEGVKAAPYCVKPNLIEFEDMLGKHNLTEEQILEEARNIVSKHGVKSVVVTLGAEGAIGVNEKEAYKVIPPNLAVASTVGAGDAFLAGMCHAFLKGADFSKQLILGISCASAKITKEGNNIPSLIELLGYSDGCKLIHL